MIADGPHHFYPEGHSKPIVVEVERGFVYAAHLEYALPVKTFKGKFIPLVEQPEPSESVDVTSKSV